MLGYREECVAGYVTQSMDENATQAKIYGLFDPYFLKKKYILKQ